MSNSYWRTKKQSEQLDCGNSITEKVNAYVNAWESRCYSEGIPEEVTDKLMASKRVPSYKAIAMAILKNNMRLLGFEGKESKWYKVLKNARRKT